MPGGGNPVPDDLSRGSYGTKFKEDARRYYGSFVGFAARGEMIPNENCYMDLDPKVKDKFGIPVARFHWKWSEPRAEPGRPRQENFQGADRGDGRHVSAGPPTSRPTRASRTPATSSTRSAAPSSATTRRSRSCNQWNQTWDVKNLFLCDGAPFASNADKNPTLTIMALAWRACDHIVDEAKKGNL